MSSISFSMRILVQCLTEYENIKVVFIDGNEVKKSGRQICIRTPQKIDNDYTAQIRVHNVTSKVFYDIAKEEDPRTTRIIIDLIRQRIEISEDNEAIYYSVFCLLHEAGHYYDYLESPQKYSELLGLENGICVTNETPEDYRKRPLEMNADAYALDRLDEAIKRIDSVICHGLLLRKEEIKKRI